MKLAEALGLRADLQRRIEQLRERIKLSAIVQEGSQPPEDPQLLLNELARLCNELEGLIASINRTNSQIVLNDGQTVTDALAHRDVLKLRIGILRNAAETASRPIAQYSRSEIRQLATFDVAALRREIDQLAQEYRLLDTAIQEVNWTTELK